MKLSITWPALLDDVCPMQLSLVGRVLRSDGCFAACTLDKYEFRTRGRGVEQLVDADSALPRWSPALLNPSPENYLRA